ncbi:MAG: 5'/3'-nucleotidase SurE [Verrucomicrobiaceae bacterium]|nr:5'/3'-nucleotidase SurE [Verrucomicrobiaceae bacterium]
MHLLLTNDDGIEAPGLLALEQVCRTLGHRVSVVAPASEQSMCGHRVTTYSPIKVASITADRWAVSGTPADCVRIALFGLGLTPDAVFSGINAGGNLGQDIYISGTCAGAREAAYYGVRAAAFSHYLVRDLAVNWSQIQSWLPELTTRVLAQNTSRGAWTNINFPHLPGENVPLPDIRTTTPEARPLGVSYDVTPAEALDCHSFQYSARYADRPRTPGSDVDVVFGGAISWSEMTI